jgi:DNA-binding transcriptional MerR regulator
MPPQFPISAVAKLTDITVDTLRAWERRYKAVRPERASRGRLYSERDVRRLVLLRRLVDNGHSISQVAGKSDDELEALAIRAFPPEPSEPPQSASDSIHPEIASLLKAIERTDYEAMNEELGRLSIVLGASGLVHKVVLPVMRLSGERWANGEFEILQVQMFSACVRNLLGGLVRLQRPADGAPTLFLTTPPNEMHEFGILAAALLAVGRQFRVVYLGPNLPVRDIIAAARKFAPCVIALGITKVNATPEAREDIRQVAEGLPPTVELWLGGTGAASVASDLARDRALILEDLSDFEDRLDALRFGRHRKAIS